MRAARPEARPDIWLYPAIADNLRLDPIMRWLAREEPHFPDTPWLALKTRATSEIQKERAAARGEEARINATLPPGQKWCSGKIAGNPGDPVKAVEWMVVALRNPRQLRIGGAGFTHIWRGDVQAFRRWADQQVRTFSGLQGFEIEPVPHGGIIHGAIDWRATNGEIMEKLKSFLEENRPAQFKDHATTAQVQRSFDIALPFRKNSALDWLGVYRRRKMVSTWAEFFALYPEESKNKRPPKSTHREIVHSKKVQPVSSRVNLDENRLRAREDDLRKAKLILKWFDEGTPLNKSDFK